MTGQRRLKVIIVALLGLLLVGPAHTQETYWIGPGNWATTNCWDSGVPAADVTAFVYNGGTAKISDPGAACNYLIISYGSQATFRLVVRW